MNDSESDLHNETELPAWARDLEAMRRRRHGASEAGDDGLSLHAGTVPPSELEASEAQRMQAYRQYLQSWQQQHNLAPETDAAERTDILFGDEWQRECSEILAHESAHETHTVLLKLDLGEDVAQTLSPSPSATEEDLFAAPDADTHATPCTVKVMTPPLGTDVRVAVMDEGVLMRQLQEKLRDHLNDAVSGVVKTAIQRQLHTLVQNLQTEIPQELASVTEEVLRLHVQQALDEIKAAAGIVKKVS